MKKLRYSFLSILLLIFTFIFFNSSLSAMEVSKDKIHLIKTTIDRPDLVTALGTSGQVIDKVNGVDVAGSSNEVGKLVDRNKKAYYTIFVTSHNFNDYEVNNIDLKSFNDTEFSNQFRVFTTKQEALNAANNIFNTLKNSTLNYKNKWRKTLAQWYYIDNNGKYKYNQWWKSNNKWYFFIQYVSVGSPAISTWMKISNVWYKFNKDCSLYSAKTWYKYSNKWMYNNGSKGFYSNVTKVIDGVNYNFDANGYAHKVK